MIRLRYVQVRATSFVLGRAAPDGATARKALMSTIDLPFDTVLRAVASNGRAEGGNGRIILMVERPFRA